MFLILSVTVIQPTQAVSYDPGILTNWIGDRSVEEEALPQARFTKTSDINLLAMTCTAEAESEPTLGKILVMATLINRAVNNRTTLLTELRRPHQFPWWGRTSRINSECEELARRYVLNHTFTQVTHFHHRRIRPQWTRNNRVLYAVGHHIFYDLER